MNLDYRIGSYGYMHTRIRDVSNFKNVDVLFLGSSHSYRGFDPRIFAKHNITSFNLGSSAQTPIQTEILLSRYLDALNPRLIVFDVTPGIFALDGVESSVDIIANDQIRMDTVKMALTVNDFKTYNTLFYGIFRQILGLDAAFTEEKKKVKEKSVYISGGYVEQELAFYTPSKFTASRNIRVVKFNAKQVDAFNRCVNIIESKKIKYVLVRAPTTSELYKTIDNSTESDVFFHAYGNYYNFNNILSLSDSSYFQDMNHLNQIGVGVFNEELIALLKRGHFLKSCDKP